VCRLVVMCRQLRCRDVSSSSIALHCRTKPIIESSSALKLCCWQLKYKHLKEQMLAAGLSPFHNFWSDTHDFTSGHHANWHFIAQDMMRWGCPGLLHRPVPPGVQVAMLPSYCGHACLLRHSRRLHMALNDVPCSGGDDRRSRMHLSGLRKETTSAHWDGLQIIFVCPPEGQLHIWLQ
jgi:hypothetical protein